MTTSQLSNIVFALLAGFACKGSANQPPPAPDPATGSAARPATGSAKGSAAHSPAGAPAAIRWTGTDGELVLALATDGALEGPCGVTGKVTATEVEIGGERQPWTDVTRTGRTYQIAKLPWTIQLGATGEATLTQKDGTKVPLGKVTGTESESALGWFGALIVAVPTIKIKLSLASLDDKLVLDLEGPADVESWEIHAAGSLIARQQRGAPWTFSGTPATHVDPTKIGATLVAPESFGNGSGPAGYRRARKEGEVVRAFVAIEAAEPRAYLHDHYVITEAADGALSWEPAESKKSAPLARLRGRQACHAHDRAVLALVRTFLASQEGWKMTRAAESKWH